MKRNLILGLILCITSIAAFAQGNYTTPIVTSSGQAAVSYDVGTYSALAYNWSGAVFSGSTGTGAYTISLYAPAITTIDGRRIAIFANTTLPPITIGNAGSGTMETVTPSSVSNCGSLNIAVASQGICQITATFTYAHGRGDFIGSGDAGIQEALNDAANNGAGQVFFQCDTGVITLATGAATTTYAQGSTGAPNGYPASCPTSAFPVAANIWGVAGRVTTTITSACTGWSIGDGTTSARWIANNTGLTAGTTAVNTGAAWTTAIASATTGINLAVAKGLVVTCAGGNPGAGAVKVRVWGVIPVAATF